MTEEQQPLENKLRSTNVVKVLALSYFLAVIILLAVWADKTQFSKSARQARELESYQTRWESQHITHYRMKLTYVGYGVEGAYQQMPLTVEVEGEQVVSAVDAQGKSWSSRRRPMTIPALFAFASEQIGKASDLNIEYDPALGYPTTIDVTPYTEPCCQGYLYAAQNLQALP